MARYRVTIEFDCETDKQAMHEIDGMVEFLIQGYATDVGATWDKIHKAKKK